MLEGAINDAHITPKLRPDIIDRPSNQCGHKAVRTKDTFEILKKLHGVISIQKCC
jgi:hypothetical protein